MQQWRAGVCVCAALFKCKSKKLGEGLMYCRTVNPFDDYLSNSRWYCGDAIHSLPDNKCSICLNYIWHQFIDMQIFVDLILYPFPPQPRPLNTKSDGGGGGATSDFQLQYRAAPKDGVNGAV